MTDQTSTTFRSAALASRLLTAEQIDAAIEAISAESGGPPARLVEVSDDVLADKLVEMEQLNHWQAEQLRAGRTKFTLKDYQIVDSIGQGGMGQVFKAVHSIMGRVVAIKVLPRSKSTPEAIKGFLHEIKVLGQMDDQNLVRAYDAGEDGNVHFLVTEFVPGTDLRQLVRAGEPLSQRDAATIIAQAAMGLQHAHEKGLIHRDVKPGNLMVTPEGKTKVLDLGLAGFLRDDLIDEEDPRKGRIVGTADYLAPEIIINPENMSPKCDIYSLGCTLYYALTRKVPFPGGTTHEKCHRHCHEVPLNPRRFNPSLSDEFLDVLADMMEKDPDKRIPTMAAVVQRLAPWTDETVKTTLPLENAGFAHATPTPPPLPGSTMADTQDFPEVHPLEDLDNSSSQMSQGTMRDSASAQETSPAIDRPRTLPPRPGLPVTNEPVLPVKWLLVLIGVPVALLTVMMVALLVWLLF